MPGVHHEFVRAGRYVIPMQLRFQKETVTSTSNIKGWVSTSKWVDKDNWNEIKALIKPAVEECLKFNGCPDEEIERCAELHVSYGQEIALGYKIVPRSTLEQTFNILDPKENIMTDDDEDDELMGNTVEREMRDHGAEFNAYISTTAAVRVIIGKKSDQTKLNSTRIREEMDNADRRAKRDRENRGGSEDLRRYCVSTHNSNDPGTSASIPENFDNGNLVSEWGAISMFSNAPGKNGLTGQPTQTSSPPFFRSELPDQPFHSPTRHTSPSRHPPSSDSEVENIPRTFGDLNEIRDANRSYTHVLHEIDPGDDPGDDLSLPDISESDIEDSPPKRKRVTRRRKKSSSLSPSKNKRLTHANVLAVSQEGGPGFSEDDNGNKRGPKKKRKRTVAVVEPMRTLPNGQVSFEHAISMVGIDKRRKTRPGSSHGTEKAHSGGGRTKQQPAIHIVPPDDNRLTITDPPTPLDIQPAVRFSPIKEVESQREKDRKVLKLRRKRKRNVNIDDDPHKYERLTPSPLFSDDSQSSEKNAFSSDGEEESDEPQMPVLFPEVRSAEEAPKEMPSTSEKSTQEKTAESGDTVQEKVAESRDSVQEKVQSETVKETVGRTTEPEKLLGTPKENVFATHKENLLTTPKENVFATHKENLLTTPKEKVVSTPNDSVVNRPSVSGTQSVQGKSQNKRPGPEKVPIRPNLLTADSPKTAVAKTFQAIVNSIQFQKGKPSRAARKVFPKQAAPTKTPAVPATVDQVKSAFVQRKEKAVEPAEKKKSVDPAKIAAILGKAIANNGQTNENGRDPTTTNDKSPDITQIKFNASKKRMKTLAERKAYKKPLATATPSASDSDMELESLRKISTQKVSTPKSSPETRKASPEAKGPRLVLVRQNSTSPSRVVGRRESPVSQLAPKTSVSKSVSVGRSRENSSSPVSKSRVPIKPRSSLLSPLPPKVVTTPKQDKLQPTKKKKLKKVKTKAEVKAHQTKPKMADCQTQTEELEVTKLSSKGTSTPTSLIPRMAIKVSRSCAGSSDDEVYDSITQPRRATLLSPVPASESPQPANSTNNKSSTSLVYHPALGSPEGDYDDEGLFSFECPTIPSITQSSPIECLAIQDSSDDNLSPQKSRRRDDTPGCSIAPYDDDPFQSPSSPQPGCSHWTSTPFPRPATPPPPSVSMLMPPPMARPPRTPRKLFESYMDDMRPHRLSVGSPERGDVEDIDSENESLPIGADAFNASKDGSFIPVLNQPGMLKAGMRFMKKITNKNVSAAETEEKLMKRAKRGGDSKALVPFKKKRDLSPDICDIAANKQVVVVRRSRRDSFDEGNQTGSTGAIVVRTPLSDEETSDVEGAFYNDKFLEYYSSLIEHSEDEYEPQGDDFDMSQGSYCMRKLVPQYPLKSRLYKMHLAKVRGTSMEDILAHLKAIQNDLVDIFRGATPSKRHEIYERGFDGKKELRGMNMTMPFTSEQGTTIVTTLYDKLIPDRTKRCEYMDYFNYVLVPEAYIRIYSRITGISYEWAENEMRLRACWEGDVPVNAETRSIMPPME